MHTVFSDGRASIDDMALAAIQKGLAQITITDHMPLPYDTRYAMDRKKVNQYRLAVREAQAKYAGRLDIKLGIEIEFLPEFRFWVYSILEMGWDLSLVSIHSLFFDNTAYIVNGNKKEFDRLLERYNYNIRALYQDYFKTIQAAFNTGWFDIAAHLDVLKKHDARREFFTESDPVYRSLIMETLDIIKKQKMKMEINMAGFEHPVGEQYPSLWIIQAAAEKNIPMILSSDSHAPQTIGQYFHKAEDFLKEKQATPV